MKHLIAFVIFVLLTTGDVWARRSRQTPPPPPPPPSVEPVISPV